MYKYQRSGNVYITFLGVVQRVDAFSWAQLSIIGHFRVHFRRLHRCICTLLRASRLRRFHSLTSTYGVRPALFILCFATMKVSLASLSNSMVQKTAK